MTLDSVTGPATASGRPSAPDWRAGFIERFGVVGDDIGLPQSMTRLLGWLVVCDPVLQSAAQIQEALSLSAGSVSTGMNALVRAGLAERVSLPGERRRYYRLRPGGWHESLAARVRVCAEIRRLTDVAITGAGGEADGRLREMRTFYGWCEERFTDLLGADPAVDGNGA